MSDEEPAAADALQAALHRFRALGEAEVRADRLDPVGLLKREVDLNRAVTDPRAPGRQRDAAAAEGGALEQTTLSVKDRAATFVNRGILRARKEDAEGALADYDQGITLNALLGEAYVDRGAVMIVLKHYDDALTDFDKGISLGANRLEIATLE